MSLLRNREMRFRYLLPKAAGFLVMALVSLALVLTALGLTRKLFVTTTALAISLPDSRGIRPGTAVMLRGFRIGQVEALELSQSGRVDASIAIESRYLPWLGSDSSVRRGRDNLLGDVYLDIEPRQKGAELAAGDTLRFVDGGELDDLMAQTQAKLMPLLENADVLVRQIGDPEGEWQGTLTAVQQTVQRLEGTLQRLDQTLVQSQKIGQEGRELLRQELQPVLADSRQLIHDARQTSAAVTALAGEMQATLPVLSLKISSNLDALQQLTPEVARTTQTGEILLQSTQESLDGLRSRWPLQTLLPQPDEPLLPQHSGQ